MTATNTEAPARKPWRLVAPVLAAEIASGGFPRGDLAELRRMDSDTPDTAAFWRLAAKHDLLGHPRVERKWALILRGIALMTPTGNTGHRTAHDKTVPVGKALFVGGDPGRATGYYSETRLNRLLTARGSTLTSLLTRMFRMMAAANQPFDWAQMANLILSDGYDEQSAERVRRSIASAYYRAENQARRPAE